MTNCTSDGIVYAVPLNPRQLLFAKNMAIGNMSQTEAAKRAGYAEDSAYNQGHVLMKNSEVLKEIEELREQRARAEAVDAQWIIAKLMQIASRCTQEEGIYDKEGNLIEFKFDSSGANKALELVGKAKNIFEAHQQAGATKIPDFSKFQMGEAQDRLRKKEEE